MVRLVRHWRRSNEILVNSRPRESRLFTYFTGLGLPMGRVTLGGPFAK